MPTSNRTTAVSTAQENLIRTATSIVYSAHRHDARSTANAVIRLSNLAFGGTITDTGEQLWDAALNLVANEFGNPIADGLRLYACQLHGLD